MFLDRFCTLHTYFLSVTLWSEFTALNAPAANQCSLVAIRHSRATAEAPCLTANDSVLVTWFPARERARANSVYSVGMYFGIAFLSPLLFWITATFGWRTLFALVGGLGVVFGLVFWWQYREPQNSPWTNQAE